MIWKPLELSGIAVDPKVAIWEPFTASGKDTNLKL